MVVRQIRKVATSYHRVRAVRHAISFAIFAIRVAATAAPVLSELTLDDVIGRNTEAMGGATAIEHVKAVEISLHIADPGRFQADGVYYAVRPGKMRMNIMADGKCVYMERYDGSKGWQWEKGRGEQEEAKAATAALRHGVELPGNLFGLHEMKERGHRLELKERQSIDGVDYHVIHVSLSDGYETLLFVDPQTWRISRRRDVRPLHPDIDPTPTIIESRKSDWRQVDGVWYAFRGEDVDVKTGMVIETSKVNDIKINPSIDPMIFTHL